MKARYTVPRISLIPSATPRPRLPRVAWVERQGPVLHPTALAGDDPGVRGLNVLRGCVHRCPFCSVRASPNYPGDAEVFLFANTAQLLRQELPAADPPVRAVYLSPATDPFPPQGEVQDEVAEIIRVLAEHGVEVWLMTRGLIRPRALAVLAGFRDRVKVTVGLLTLDRQLQRLLEPLAAPPRLRLAQVAHLRRLGVPVQVALDPLVPGLTDTRDNLEPLLHALADLGVTHLTAGYLFLRDGIRDHLAETLGQHGLARTVLDAFRGGPLLSAEGLAPARYLPRATRQRGYATLMALASRHGIAVRIQRLTNPDFTSARSPGPVPSA